MKILIKNGCLVFKTIQIDLWISLGFYGFSYSTDYCDGSHYLLNLGLIQFCWVR
jgi:hypothetical protein